LFKDCQRVSWKWGGGDVQRSSCVCE
jgi:hypothetical protein